MSQNDFMENMKNPYLSNISTDTVVSNYENWVNQSISSKTLSAIKKGTVPQFTVEETAYITKKACLDNQTSEIAIITPDPVITLKKGKTELNIGHAATLVKKMEEKYPTTNTKQDYPQIDEFKYKVNFPSKHVNEEVDNDSVPIKTVNKNAYEIRESVLSHALDWVQYSYDIHRGSPTVTSIPVPTEDDVLNVAQKFYKFVENRR